MHVNSLRYLLSLPVYSDGLFPSLFLGQSIIQSASTCSSFVVCSDVHLMDSGFCLAFLSALLGLSSL